MEVSKITYSQPLYVNKLSGRQNNVSQQKNITFGGLQPSVKNYDNAIKQAVKFVYKNDSEAEKNFRELITSFGDVLKFEKTLKSYDVFSIYSQRGFRGLLYEFWKSEPIQPVKNFLNGDVTDLVKQDGKPVFQIVHFKGLLESKKSPNNVKFVFINPKNDTSVQFGLNSKGELDVCQTDTDKTVITKFHLVSGNRKCVVEQQKDSNPETTYYNMDGSKSFFKNLFRGGVAIIPH